MASEFNLIDEAWIRVMTPDFQVREVSLRDALLNAQNFLGLAGEMKTQDFVILRLLLAIMYTVFYRYDLDGNEIDLRDNPDLVFDNWCDMWKARRIPSKPIEIYFEKWRDRFWLFDDEHPFFQSNALKETGSYFSSAKMIGTLFESANKRRLFPNRINEGRELTYSEAARWLLHLNSFDDTAAKRPTPKRTWLSRCGLVAVKGESLFETIFLNFYANYDISKDVFDEKPSWEDDNNIAESNRLIVPKDQAALLSIMSRRIWLCREGDKITGYRISGGNYFEDDELFNVENMTLWTSYQEGKDKNAPYKIKPKSYTSTKKIWREFSIIAGSKETEDTAKFKRPGVLDWVGWLMEKGILDSKLYVVKLVTAAVIYELKAMLWLVIDNVSDGVDFHAQLLQDVGVRWRTRIIEEIEKCEKAAQQVFYLYKALQKAKGRADKDAKTELSGESDAKMQFYDRIDRPFRLWLAGIDDTQDIDKYTASLEKELLLIAKNFGEEISKQIGSQNVFSYRKLIDTKDDKKKSKEGNDKKFAGEMFSAALNRYFATISKKIFDRAGENQ